ncbi:gluconokinase [Pantoea sp. 1.19]|uniref:gluconokinase n=1 Tax=Pantoea sp. 1.19 TaxID=1925589 RepID=UPI00094891ED|nr:gluconokinase [Pantoea sp. 1.19]
MSASSHHAFVLMGVSGSGKTVIASELARRLSAAFLDGDFLHPRANIDKMARGEPLNDDDRAPWLAKINDAIYAMQRTQPVSLVVCSALKRQYRDRLRQDSRNLTFLWLKGDYAVIESRMKARKNHFFKPQMLQTQFATLEAPGADEPDVIALDISVPVEEVIAQAQAAIARVTGTCAD